MIFLRYFCQLQKVANVACLYSIISFDNEVFLEVCKCFTLDSTIIHLNLPEEINAMHYVVFQKVGKHRDATFNLVLYYLEQLNSGTFSFAENQQFINEKICYNVFR